jgi:hypothetical protein
VAEFDERDYGVDLDNSGELSRADTIAYSDEPGSMKLIGRAGVLQGHNRIHLEPGLFPESAEFFHSLRYLDISKEREVTQAPRVKEIRYSVKKRWYPPVILARFAADEIKEKAYTPDRPRWVRGNQEFGVSNALGWQYRGFIEDGDGDLRPQTHEELVFCVGCHSGIGATTDSNFSFARKIGDNEIGYLSGMTAYGGARSPLATSAQRLSPELHTVLKGYAAYFEHNGSLNDFRNLSADISGDLTAQSLRSLFWPSAGNAMLLNKAYRTIVQEQSYVRGRDAIISPLVYILRKVEKGAETGVTTPVEQP